MNLRRRSWRFGNDAFNPAARPGASIPHLPALTPGKSGRERLRRFNALVPGGWAGGWRSGCRSSVGGDRKSVVQGKSVSVRVDLGGRRIIKKKTFHVHNVCCRLDNRKKLTPPLQ